MRYIISTEPIFKPIELRIKLDSLSELEQFYNILTTGNQYYPENSMARQVQGILEELGSYITEYKMRKANED